MLTASFVYREEAPLASALDAVYTIDVRHDCCGTLPYRTLPDGCIDLIYRLKRDLMGKVDAACLIVAGATNRPSTYFPTAGEEFIGVRFAPGWGGFALGLSAEELVGQVLESSNLNIQLAKLEHCLFACESKQQAVGLLRRTAEFWTSERFPHRQTLAAINALRISGGQLTVGQTADLAGMSSRTFRRKVMEAAGLSPKALSRIFRFRQAVNRMQQDRKMPLMDLALCAGYADQAHMTREFRALGGFTPRSQSNWKSQSDYSERIAG